MDDVKAAIQPLEIAGPSGTVVLWHSLLAHVGGQNALPDVIRQAAIYDVHKTPESLPDATIIARGAASDSVLPGIWDDWSDEVRQSATTTGADTSAARL